MILGLIMIIFSLINHYDDNLPGENICETRLGGICVAEHACHDRIPRPADLPNVFTCPQVLGPDITIVCCRKESKETCQEKHGECMSNCGIPVRRPSRDCPKKGKMCCVLTH